MRTENIVSGPIKTTYKFGVYGALAVCGVFLTAFIIWSIASFGGAAVKLISELI